jgi:hypothetical protein
LETAKSFSGDIFGVSRGKDKKILWNYKQDGFQINKDKLHFKITVTLLPEKNIAKGLLYSTIFPGSGFRQIGSKNQYMLGVAGYGLLGSTVAFNIMSTTSMKNYRNSLETDQSDSYLKSANTNKTIALACLGAGVAVWTWNYIKFFRNASRNKSADFAKNAGKKVYTAISPICKFNSEKITTFPLDKIHRDIKSKIEEYFILMNSIGSNSDYNERKWIIENNFLKLVWLDSDLQIYNDISIGSDFFSCQDYLTNLSSWYDDIFSMTCDTPDLSPVYVDSENKYVFVIAHVKRSFTGIDSNSRPNIEKKNEQLDLDFYFKYQMDGKKVVNPFGGVLFKLEKYNSSNRYKQLDF